MPLYTYSHLFVHFYRNAINITFTYVYTLYFLTRIYLLCAFFRWTNIQIYIICTYVRSPYWVCVKQNTFPTGEPNTCQWLCTYLQNIYRIFAHIFWWRCTLNGRNYEPLLISLRTSYITTGIEVTVYSENEFDLYPQRVVLLPPPPIPLIRKNQSQSCTFTTQLQYWPFINTFIDR